jgi:hypothetical protein
MNVMSEPAPPHPIRERLDEVYRRLRALPHAENADAALRQLCDTLEQVEDEWSGVAKKSPPPAPAEFDGRMYCPLEDFVTRLEDGGILALTRAHRIEIAANGVMRIVSKLSGQAEFEK